MTKFQSFIRNHILLVGLAIVLVPLASLLLFQYWSLSKLEETSTVADVVWRKNYLNDVAKEIRFFYHNNTEQTLSIPAASVRAKGLRPEIYPFGKCSVEGAKRLFIAAFDSKGETEFSFYDPYNRTFIPHPPDEEVRAANIAIAALKLLSREDRIVNTELMLEYVEPNDRVFIKPILDDSSKVIGAAGMLLDEELFKKVYLPQIIWETLPRFFPAEKQDNVIVTVYDEKNNVIFSTQPGKGRNDDTSVPLPIYGNLRLAICSSNFTPGQWAHWNFKLNLTLSALMSAVLLAGVILAFRAAQRQMRLSKMKTDFVSNVSHELRTPLASIRVFGEFLKTGRVQDEEKMCEYGEYIETESRRLTQLINKILDFSRIESGRKIYDFQRACISDLVHATLKTFEVQLKQRGFTVDVKEPAQPLPAIYIDSAAISQALINLLDNAVKYSNDAREIEIWLGRENNFITIAVRDYGIGLKREDQQKVFEKFYRVCTGLVHETRGSGLGLSLVKQIVEAHHGRISVESEPGCGSTFKIHLPVKDEAAECEHKPSVSSSILQAGD